MDTTLKIVRLMEPALCLTCRFKDTKVVQTEGGDVRQMFHCKRLDCDNWQEDKTCEKPRRVI